MNSNNGNTDNSFVDQLILRLQQKEIDYNELLQESRRIERDTVRIQEYIDQLKNFIRGEGRTPPVSKVITVVRSGVGKTGNRSKAYPLRKIQWENMTINQIIGSVLSVTPEATYHPTEMANETYEINTDSDLRKVLPNMRSSMQKGARDGLWENASRGRFKAKVTEQQGALVNT